MKRLLSIVFLACLLIGCDAGKELSRTNVGPITSAIVAPIEYHARIWTSVSTENVSVCIAVKEPILIGKDAYLVQYSSGRQGFTWDNAQYVYFIRYNR